MSDVLIVQNTDLEGPGMLEHLLRKDGFDLNLVNAKHEALQEKEYSLIIILGATESANDNLPYLIQEQTLIKKSVEKNIPVLGICLGSQLIAKTFGGKVFGGHKKEIGFYHDLVSDGNPSLFAGFKNPFTVFHWHGDTFELPEGSTRLVRSQDYPNQAFQFQSAVGLQFHLEVNEEMIKLWLDKTEEKLQHISYIDIEKIRNDIEENIIIVKSNMEIFYKNFKSSFHL